MNPVLKTANPYFEVQVRTRQGDFILSSTCEGLHSLRFLSVVPVHQPECPPSSVPQNAPAFLSRAVRLLEAYFEGQPVILSDLPFDLRGLSPFAQSVLKILSRVPRGKLISYGDLAKQAGKPGGARAIGQVMHRNRLPVFIPCHRVVAAKGALGGFSLGLGWKQCLLALEGKTSGTPHFPSLELSSAMV